MIPVLYPPNTTDFSTFGRGVLTDTVSCEVTEERNGVFECLLKYPVSGQHYGLITKECIVKAKPNDTAADQAFRIYRITKPLAAVVVMNICASVKRKPTPLGAKFGTVIISCSMRLSYGLSENMVISVLLVK